MEIKQSAIVVKLDSEEKQILEKAVKIIDEIEHNPIIEDSCSHDCPFKRYCNLANNEDIHDCLLHTTIFNLKEILNNT